MRVLACLIAGLALVAGQNCDPDEIVYFPHNSQCDMYSECRKGVYKEDLLCPDGLLFNDKITNGAYPCSYETEVDCNGRTGRQNAQPTEFCGHQWGYFGSGDSAQCGYYYNCVDGFAHRMECPAGLAFSSATYRCEWPDESVDCDSNAFLGFSCPESQAPIQLLLRGFQQFRSTRNCREFFICVNQSPRLQFCQLGLVFDDQTNTCVEPEYVQGCQDTYTQEELALYREQRERAKIAAERRQAELNSLREELAERRRRQQ